eukprot:341283-Chlamydomonas_euryale.AAC.7
MSNGRRRRRRSIRSATVAEAADNGSCGRVRRPCMRMERGRLGASRGAALSRQHLPALPVGAARAIARRLTLAEPKQS